MSDYREMMEGIKKLEAEAEKTGEAAVGVVVVHPNPKRTIIKLLEKTFLGALISSSGEKDDKGKAG
jgi:hypothetical protein